MDKIALQLYMPLGFAIPPVAFWLFKPAVILKNNRGNARPIVLMLSALFIAVPLGFCYNYISHVAGTYQRLSSPALLKEHPHATFFQFDSCYVDKREARLNTFSSAHKGAVAFHFFAVMPLYNTAADTVSAQPLAWVGVYYDKKDIETHFSVPAISNYDVFATYALQMFNDGDFSKFTYLKRIRRSFELDGCALAASIRGDYAAAHDTFFFAYNTPFSQRAGNSLWWLLLVAGISCGAYYLFVQFSTTDMDELEAYCKGRQSEK